MRVWGNGAEKKGRAFGPEGFRRRLGQTGKSHHIMGKPQVSERRRHVEIISSGVATVTRSHTYPLQEFMGIILLMARKHLRRRWLGFVIALAAVASAFYMLVAEPPPECPLNLIHLLFRH